MGKIIVSEFVGLDGVMQAPGGEDHPDGKQGWSMASFTPDLGDAAFAILKSADALLLGRSSYEHFAAAWPQIEDEQGFADRMNSLPKFVVTSRKDGLEWNAQPIELSDVSELKETSGNLLILGSGQLVHGLTDRGLIDEWHVFVHPVIVGSGSRLFEDGNDLIRLALTDTKQLSGGVVWLTYSPASAAA
jgi:dihydrofolate reductase